VYTIRRCSPRSFTSPAVAKACTVCTCRYMYVYIIICRLFMMYISYGGAHTEREFPHSNSDDPQQMRNVHICMCNAYVCVHNFCDVYIIWKCSQSTFTSSAMVMTIDRCAMCIYYVCFYLICMCVHVNVCVCVYRISSTNFSLSVRCDICSVCTCV